MNKFVSQYNKLLKDRHEMEDSEDHKNRQCNRRERGGWPVGRHARKVYTRVVYGLFQKEVDRGKVFNVVVKGPGLYETVHAYAEHRPEWARSTFEIRVDGERYSCECGLYTHFGVLCCHAIRMS